jgi:hypothetical protein
MKWAAFFLLLAASQPANDYQSEARRQYLKRALEAVTSADPQKLGDAANYVSTMDRNTCRSTIRRLRVQCLIEAAAKNCRGLEADKKEQCTLYSDIIVTSALGEKRLIDEEQRYRIMQQHRDYRAALRAELKGMYGALAAGLRVSEHYHCKPADVDCLATAIDNYCSDQADRQDLSWQHCAAGLVWFIGTAPRGG